MLAWRQGWVGRLAEGAHALEARADGALLEDELVEDEPAGGAPPVVGRTGAAQGTDWLAGTGLAGVAQAGAARVVSDPALAGMMGEAPMH